ncbi:MAG: class I SAM-dependent methyltransferase [Fibrobacterota bacterium]
MFYQLEDPDTKRRINLTVFDIVSTRYDIATRVLSFGQDQSWKKRFADLLPDLHAPRVLDLASGSGDLLRRLQKRYPEGTVLGADLNRHMIDTPANRRADLSLQDMQNLAVRDGSLDLVTGGYALRNAPDPDKTIAEIHRVLKPGGQVFLLDFAAPRNRVRRLFHRGLLYVWGALWSLLLHGKPFVYTYIPDSMKNYPDWRSLRSRVYLRGFTAFRRRSLFFGFCEIISFRRMKDTSSHE